MSQTDEHLRTGHLEAALAVRARRSADDSEGSSRHYLSICATFRDEGPYLDEWIRFHRDQGVDHFFMYDNDSRDDGAARLEPFVRDGIVTLIPWPRPHVPGQVQAYTHCLTANRETSRWIAFIDIDEFLFATSMDLPTFLSAYEGYGGLVVNWQIYGSSGHTCKPGNGVLSGFLRKAPEQWIRNRQFKSIVNPRLAVAPLSAHRFAYAAPHFAVREDRRPVVVGYSGSLGLALHVGRRLVRVLQRTIPAFAPHLVAPAALLDSVSVRQIRINHYIVRSRQEYEFKQRRHPTMQSGRYNNGYFRFFDRNEVYDPIAAVRAARVPAHFAPRPPSPQTPPTPRGLP